MESEEYIEKISIDINEDEANVMAVSENGKLLAFTGPDKYLAIWRINNGQC